MATQYQAFVTGAVDGRKHAPLLPSYSNQPGSASNGVVTVTVTQTIAVPTDRPTRTIGRPWTTATPSLWTIHPYGPGNNGEVIARYPPQPQHLWCAPPPKVAIGGRIAGAFFGGFGAALVLCVILGLVMRMKKKSALRKRSKLEGLSAVLENEEESEVIFEEPLLDTPTPKGKRVQLPPDDAEDPEMRVLRQSLFLLEGLKGTK